MTAERICEQRLYPAQEAEFCKHYARYNWKFSQPGISGSRTTQRCGKFWPDQRYCHPHSFRLLTGCFFALLSVDRLEYSRYNLDLGFGHNGENVTVAMQHAALIFGLGEHLTHSLQPPTCRRR